MINLKGCIEEVMNDRKRGFFSQIFKSILLLISYVYAFFIWVNRFFYRVGILKSYKIPAVVISIGNITLGGTGKTPFAIMLAGMLHSQGRKTALLIRGYGDDEWKMMEEKLEKSGIDVFVGRDRVKNAKEAVVLGAQDIVLDDGFQHRRLKRGLNIALIDSMNPFGNGHLFPRGILREPISGLKEADIIVFTKNDTKAGNSAAIEEKLKNEIPGKVFMKARHVPNGLHGVYDGKMRDISYIKGKAVCLLSAICTPSYFKCTAEGIGSSVELEFAFPDHYLYKQKDLQHIVSACKKKNIEIILTTEKDAVKLKNLKLPDKSPLIAALAVEFEITEGRELLDESLHRLHSRVFSQNN